MEAVEFIRKIQNNCDKFENCLRCRHTHWIAGVEE